MVTRPGQLVVVSGQVAQDERGELVGPGDPAAQAQQVFENLRRCLAAAGAGLGDVVTLTFFVLDVADLPAVRAARDAVIDGAWPPASTAVQAAARSLPVSWLRWRPGRWPATDHPAPPGTPRRRQACRRTPS